LKPRQTPQWSYLVPADKPSTHSIQSLREASLTPPPPKYWKPQVTTRPSKWLSPATFYNTPNSPYSAQDQRSTWNQAILLRSLPGYLPSFRQSLAHWSPTQAKTISPSSIITSFSNPIYVTDISKSRLKIHTQTSPLTWACLKVVSFPPLLYLFYTADLLISPDSTTATFADNTAVLATDPDPAIASHKLQTSLLAIQHWLTKWQLKVKIHPCHLYHS
jgi:hypothetical protein